MKKVLFPLSLAFAIASCNEHAKTTETYDAETVLVQFPCGINTMWADAIEYTF